MVENNQIKTLSADQAKIKSMLFRILIRNLVCYKEFHYIHLWTFLGSYTKYSYFFD